MPGLGTACVLIWKLTPESHTVPSGCPWGLHIRLDSHIPCVLCLGQLRPSRSGQWLTPGSLRKCSEKWAMISRPPGRTVRHLLSEGMVLARRCLPGETLLP